MKTIFISGGTSGLGLACVRVFLKKKFNIIIAARDIDKARHNLEDSFEQINFIRTDFNNPKSIKSLFDQISEEYETIDVAINNVGAIIQKPITEYSEEEFDYQVNVNLKSLWLGLKYQIPLMTSDNERQKHIINVSSINGLGGTEFAALYAATKAGVISLTKSAALENSKSNILINCVVPGPFKTPMLENALELQSQGNKDKRLQIEAGYQNMIPLGRFGEPFEFAELVVWLSEQKSNYFNGQSFIIDGGLTTRFR